MELPEAGDLQVMFTEEEILERVRELGAEISDDYAGQMPVLVAILKGSVIFLADLLRSISLPVQVDFMAITTFESGGRPGVVRILKDLDIPVAGRPVIIVEDIIDTGLTAGYLVKNLLARDPRSLQICTLLDRTVRRLADLPLKYVGFDVPDTFIVGYGLDHRQEYRNLPFIGVLPEELLEGSNQDGSP
jgi:hypoxanthine phosphoribosyltransferase